MTSRGQGLQTPAQSGEVVEGGYLVLAALEGAGEYYATLNDRTAQHVLWDSRNLVEGDIIRYSSSLLGCMSN